MQWGDWAHVSSKAATGIHAQADRSIISNLATFRGSRRDDGVHHTGVANLSVYRLHMMVMIMRPGIIIELSGCALCVIYADIPAQGVLSSRVSCFS